MLGSHLSLVTPKSLGGRLSYGGSHFARGSPLARCPLVRSGVTSRTVAPKLLGSHLSHGDSQIARGSPLARWLPNRSGVTSRTVTPKSLGGHPHGDSQLHAGRVSSPLRGGRTFCLRPRWDGAAVVTPTRRGNCRLVSNGRAALIALDLGVLGQSVAPTRQSYCRLVSLPHRLTAAQRPAASRAARRAVTSSPGGRSWLPRCSAARRAAACHAARRVVASSRKEPHANRLAVLLLGVRPRCSARSCLMTPQLQRAHHLLLLIPNTFPVSINPAL